MSQIKLAVARAEKAVSTIWPHWSNERVMDRIEKFTKAKRMTPTLKERLVKWEALALRHELGDEEWFKQTLPKVASQTNTVPDQVFIDAGYTLETRTPYTPLNFEHAGMLDTYEVWIK